METEIRKDSYRRSWVFTSLILASLVGLFGLVYFLILYAATCRGRLNAQCASSDADTSASTRRICSTDRHTGQAVTTGQPDRQWLTRER
jgi:hypothetical protein